MGRLTNIGSGLGMLGSKLQRLGAATGTPRLRGSAGVAQRKRRMQRTHWLCEMCRDHGVTRLAEFVDHEVPLAHGGADVDSNTRNLCREHHDQVTAEQFGTTRRG